MLADALAAPPGYSLRAALVTAQSLDEPFVWTLLQHASVADNTTDHVPPPELVFIRWAGGGEYHW